MVAPEEAAIELKSLHRLLGASGRFSFGSAELMRELLGVEPGSVTPFAVINDKTGRVTVVARRRNDGARRAQLSSPGEHRHHRRSPARACSNSSRPPATVPGSRRFRPPAPETFRLHSAALFPFNQANREVRRPAGAEREGVSRRCCRQAQTTAADGFVKDTTTQAFVEDVIEEFEAPAGPGRFLGALVRPLQAAHADSRKSRCAPPRAR